MGVAELRDCGATTTGENNWIVYTVIGGDETEQGEITEVKPAYLALLSKPHDSLYGNSILLKLMP